jgi:hypothetical protein
MFPDRVGRVILDGVVDADAYVAPIWADSIEETDTIWNSFFSYCHEAGNDCELYREGDSVDDIKTRVEDMIADLEANPLIGVSRLFDTPSVITYNTIKPIIFGGLYSPLHAFPLFARIFNMVYEGEANQLHDIILQPHSIMDYEPFCSPQMLTTFNPGDAQYAIMCSDKRYKVNQHSCFFRPVPPDVSANCWPS